MPALILQILSIVLLCFLCATSRSALSSVNLQSRSLIKSEEQLYLPSGKGLFLLSFGQRNFLADILWFNAINYFGKHYASDRNYRWLKHMCDLVSSLDPRALHVYEFCALMLAWEANVAEDANQILTKAIKAKELKLSERLWRFYYLRGFNHAFFLNDGESAAADFSAGASLPYSHVIMKRLAAKKLLALGKDPDAAIAFLQQSLQLTSDEISRKALTRRLNEAIAKRNEILKEGRHE